MDFDSSRRRMLAAVGAGSASLAGCLDFLSGNDDDSEGDGENGGNGTDGDGAAWPASESGELISDFGEDDQWVPRTGEIEPAPDEAVTGDQAMVIESDEDSASAGLVIPGGMDLENWDVSVAVKMESATQISLEVIAPDRGDHLTSIRRVPDDHEGWLRVDFGYIQKHGDPDLTTVSQFNIVAFGPDGGPTRVVVDDLRRTEAVVDRGKAILAFYDGLDSHFDIAAELLEEREWAGAVPVDPTRIGSQGRMGFSELQQLRDRGWDVCSYPVEEGALPEMPEDRQRQVIEYAKETLEENDFADGSRHFFVPDDRMDESTHEIVRDRHESAFLFGAGPTSSSPTAIHMAPLIWGPDLHGGVRRAINLSDQYNQVTVLRIPAIVEDEEDVTANSMSLEDFEHLLDHLEHRGVDVITPSDVVDGTVERDGDDETEDADGGPILEAGNSHSFSGPDGDQTAEFELAKGGVECSFSHDGDGEFVVEATEIDGDLTNDLFVSTTGPGPGESITFVDEGTYRLEVEADGEWSVDLNQPEVTETDLTELPVEESGTGSSFVGPLESNDDLSLDITHDGDGEFLVDGYDASGSWEQIVNKTGEFDSSRSYSAGEATWINVEADGDWELDIS